MVFPVTFAKGSALIRASVWLRWACDLILEIWLANAQNNIAPSQGPAGVVPSRGTMRNQIALVAIIKAIANKTFAPDNKRI